MRLISQNACHKYYSKDEVNENMLCAAGRDWEEDACQVNQMFSLMIDKYNIWPRQVKISS